MAHVACPPDLMIRLTGMARRADLACPSVELRDARMALHTGHVVVPLVLGQRTAPMAIEARDGRPVMIFVAIVALEVAGAHDRRGMAGGTRQVRGGMRPMRETPPRHADGLSRSAARSRMTGRAVLRLNQRVMAVVARRR